MSWINWLANAKTCKRCGQRIPNYPCPECGFNFKQRS